MHRSDKLKAEFVMISNFKFENYLDGLELIIINNTLISALDNHDKVNLNLNNKF